MIKISSIFKQSIARRCFVVFLYLLAVYVFCFATDEDGCAGENFCNTLFKYVYDLHEEIFCLIVKISRIYIPIFILILWIKLIHKGRIKMYLKIGRTDTETQSKRSNGEHVISANGPDTDSDHGSKTSVLVTDNRGCSLFCLTSNGTTCELSPVTIFNLLFL